MDEMNRPRIETREPEAATSRAIVLDLGLARIIVGMMGAAIGVGIWVGTLVADHGGRLASLEAGRISRNAELAAINSRIDALDNRIRPVEVSVGSMASSVAFIRERVDAGLGDITDRLERLEDRLRQ